MALRFKEGDRVIGRYFADDVGHEGVIAYNETGAMKREWSYRVMMEDGSSHLHSEDELVLVESAEASALTDELERLRAIEKALADGWAWKKTQADALRTMAQKDYTNYEGLLRSNEYGRQADALDAEAEELGRLLEGKNII